MRSWSWLLLLLAVLTASCDRVTAPEPEVPPPPPPPPDERPTSGGGLPILAGVFRESATAVELVEDLDASEFAAELEARREGGRLVDFEVYTRGGEHRFAGRWETGAGLSQTWEELTCSGFTSRHEVHAAMGRHLIDFERAPGTDAEVCFGLWQDAGAGEEVFELDLDCAAFEERADELREGGLRLADVEVRHADGTDLCSGVWRAATAEDAAEGEETLVHGLSLVKLVEYQERLTAAGSRLAELEVYATDAGERWAAHWRPADDGYWLWVGSFAHCFAERREQLRAGLAPGTVVVDCDQPPHDHAESGEPGDEPGDRHPRHVPSENPAVLGPGSIAVDGLPPLHLVDVEYGTRPAPAGAVASPGRPPSHSIHLGVDHDGGSSGPGG